MFIFPALALLFVAVLTGGLLLGSLWRARQFQQRVQVAFGQVLPSARKPAAPSAPLLLRIVAAFGGAITRSGLLPARTLSEFERTLALAGLRGPNGVALFIGAKILLVVGLPMAAMMMSEPFGFSPPMARLAPVIGGVIGLLLPDKVVSWNREKYNARLAIGVPDALDMMVICTQAGLGLVPTMQRVATEIAHAHPAVAHELAQTVAELHIAVTPAAALTALGTRTEMPSLKRVATTLVQTTKYGTPLSDALRGLAGELRQEALTRYEEKAARLPVMLTIPMIIFVLPCVFIVVGGPAVLQISKALGHH